jgi:PAS domain S-box-containing protein
LPKNTLFQQIFSFRVFRVFRGFLQPGRKRMMNGQRKNSRILIIDDEESIRLTFKAFWEEEGYRVLTAKDYSSARNLLASDRDLDLIFTDIVLGEHSGIDILREVKSLDMLCPVIVITGQPDIATAADSVRLGAYDYLVKPIRRDTLLRITRFALQRMAIIAEKERYRNNLEAIFRSVADAIITVDNEMRITESNAATEKIFGISPKDIAGAAFDEVFREGFESCHKVLDETLKKQATVMEFRMECIHPDRPRQVLVINSSPLLDRNRRSRGAVLVIKDITRLTDMESELKDRHSFHNIIGKSRRMQAIYKLAEDLGDMQTTVLITGESGTGKELIARAIHYSGCRSLQPLVTVSCSALSENLLESELFGHVKGAFTGAIKDKVGHFQKAHTGTLFFDEIGDISPMIQVKLLRVLQETEFHRVGDTKPIKVDVRVITATNRRLSDAVKKGFFREDLYYRLKVVEIQVPPLRERFEDIPLLVEHFCASYNKTFQKNIQGVTREVLKLFMNYPWPGNVRELKHAVEHAFVLCRDRTITSEHIPSEIASHSQKNSAVNYGNTDIAEAQHILQVLEKTDWNKAKAARLLGINRKTLYRKLKKYNLFATRMSD